MRRFLTNSSPRGRRAILSSGPNDTGDADEAESLLPQSTGPTGSSHQPAASSVATTTTTTATSRHGTRLGRIRAYWLGSVVCMGGFLFGYDSGIVGGVLMLESFARDFGYASPHGGYNNITTTSTTTSTTSTTSTIITNTARVDSLAVALQQLGALVACFLAWPLTDRLGRRRSLMIASFVFCVGAVIQTVNSHSLAVFYAARVVAGFGLGIATVVIPMFSSEMSPKEIRGKIGSFFQWFYTFVGPSSSSSFPLLPSLRYPRHLHY